MPKQSPNITSSLLPIIIVGVTIWCLIKTWNYLADWMKRTVLSWFKDNQPKLVPLVEETFRKIDAIITPVIQKLRSNWEELKQRFIGQIVHFERENPSAYAQKICSYFRRILGGKEEIVERISDSVVDPSTLPTAIRERMLGLDSCSIDTTEICEKIIEETEERTIQK